MKNFAYKTSYFYYAILPYLGYLAVLIMRENYPADGLIIMLGWVVLLIHQTMYLAVFEATAKREYTFALPFVPPLLIAFNQTTLDLSIWNFFLEQAVIEMVGLMVGLAIVFLFFKNDEGHTAWRDMGCLPLIFVGLIGAGSWGFVATWWNQQLYSTDAAYWNILSFTVAFLIEIRANVLVLNKVVKGKLFLSEVFGGENGIGLILGQIVLWFVLPAIFYWLG